ncbi:MAG: 5-formyltetrahydrofolate cyclo-ligase [Chlorobium limicola]|uniref:5-formyltetrahydrofolate cyclo-ligase n=1 Tax=Chlorobium limicola (strain DSM 245 / NBRC 103803 / 6330) TaxID=290315 RepID=B3ECQ2_CHLL2|nr:5-formyltetrahydrofolate cyclo-ligase [Chlorobium limicola]ACD90327.1 5-formyltetrahydrofolate cyclo-ligase [Chlorobium limicola DSM 245]NTV21564.1 5-formyltetrahydrofolate cyclo-ligase [Chlorobium limicola]
MSRLTISKQLLRKELLVRRKMMPEREWFEKSALIASEVLNIREVVEAEHILVYLSIDETREVYTGELVSGLLEAGKRLSVPVVDQRRLLAVRYEPGQKLRRGIFGQSEPESIRPVDASLLQVVLLPLVAVDERGCRMGYGMGFYDRFLAELASHKCFPCRAGLAFRLQIVPELPCDSWDEPLDYAVHEDGLIHFM